jgi:hypothetical protein
MMNKPTVIVLVQDGEADTFSPRGETDIIIVNTNDIVSLSEACELRDKINKLGYTGPVIDKVNSALDDVIEELEDEHEDINAEWEDGGDDDEEDSDYEDDDGPYDEEEEDDDTRLMTTGDLYA